MTQDSSALIASGAQAVQARIPDFPKTAIVLGSGLGGFAKGLVDATTVPYGDIPGFSRSTVVGHSGNLIAGTLEGKRIAVMQGRIHTYEGHGGAAIATPIRILKRLGVETLILTNAAGGLNLDLGPGSIVMIEDHINFSGFNPLIGPNDDSFGPRFPDMSDPYDRELRAKLEAAAAVAGVAIKKGVYIFVLGPNFETAAEIRMFAKLGADLVGMSTVPECLVARHAGMKVAGISIVTNYGTGIKSTQQTHEETLATAEQAGQRLEQLLRVFVQRI
ncbi:purine-nucleoside phosphorylase [Rhizomicrobium electricum]|uniref:Purine nucleoside phosphorylase n=1 Tax=Rhizomicrobium electricum TaxID=480070 RepID=A0ABN1EPY4_9PROT|nr:purine-nucleoside phosphorylase [Rhizomicrobium electricum]NIJ48864.1 inosine/guanosine/xanthosine phosphorylase family protein [Rhizomicrobium electricum]